MNYQHLINDYSDKGEFQNYSEKSSYYCNTCFETFPFDDYCINCNNCIKHCSCKNKNKIVTKL